MSHKFSSNLSKGKEKNKMFGLETLNVLIGLVTVYLAFGVACTAIVEAILTWFKIRSKQLEAALSEFLAGDLKQNETFVKAFYDHPLVQALSKGKDGRPSYIPSKIVGQVVEALVTANGTAKSLTAAVKSLPGEPATNRIKGLLDTFVTRANEDVDKFRKSVEKHFDEVMDRATGWIKRYSQTVALVASAVLVIGANVDTVKLVTSLASNPTAQAKTVEIAQQQLSAAKTVEPQVESGKTEGGITVDQAKKPTDAASVALNQAVSSMESAGLRFGWQDYPKGVKAWCTKIAGLLVSIFAISLGAPFWFDMLQRIMQVRSSIKPGEKKNGK
jgi:hypothetical protein